MAMDRPAPTNVEHFFDIDEIIVSKTDTRGVITYANDVFLRLAGYEERELLGVQHNIIRHPDMPRCVFKLLWDTISAGQEIFAFVKNLRKDGGFYWVFAHVTPDLDPSTGAIVGYHSSRRVVADGAKAEVLALYRVLLEEETRHSPRSVGLERSTQRLLQLLGENGVTYEQFVFDLYQRHPVRRAHHAA